MGRWNDEERNDFIFITKFINQRTFCEVQFGIRFHVTRKRLHFGRIMFYEKWVIHDHEMMIITLN